MCDSWSNQLCLTASLSPHILCIYSVHAAAVTVSTNFFGVVTTVGRNQPDRESSVNMERILCP